MKTSDSVSSIWKKIQNKECVFKKDKSNIRKNLLKATLNNALQEDRWQYQMKKK